jgi:hypothetical protein
MLACAAVGCKPRLGRPVDPGFPISGFSVSMRNCYDDDAIRLDLINDVERVPTEEIAASAVFEWWPRLWLL